MRLLSIFIGKWKDIVASLIANPYDWDAVMPCIFSGINVAEQYYILFVKKWLFELALLQTFIYSVLDYLPYKM